LTTNGKDTTFFTNNSNPNYFFLSFNQLLHSTTVRVVGGQSRKMAKPIFGRGAGGAV